jgi:multidrug efflux pump subunit AcrA (membrane-fusion protein)
MNYEAKVSDLSGTSSVLIEDAENTGRSSRRGLVIAAVVLIALLIGGTMLFYSQSEESPFPVANGQQIPTVSVVAPGRTTVAGVIHSTGTLAARREMPVGVVGEGGRVVSVLVEPGDWVRAGQALLVIDRSVQNQQAQSSAAQIQVARADANLAQANLDRALKLVDRGFISKADVDRLTATRDAANARLLVSQAQYRELLARNARLNIVAPAAGLVLERNVEPGQVVGAGGTALFTIAKGGEMELLANMTEDDLAAVSVGSTASVRPRRQRQDPDLRDLAGRAGDRPAKPAGHGAVRDVLRSGAPSGRLRLGRGRARSVGRAAAARKRDPVRREGQLRPDRGPG